MKILFFILCISWSLTAKAQNTSVNIQKLDSLLLLKKNMIKNHDIKSFYTIQLFSGNRKNAENAKTEYDSKDYKYPVTIEYETPNYKVWIGQFRTKLYADKAFNEIKKDYPNALILRPG
ncbi:SPOR domain-containing protein [Mesohalobacter halotolerans]|uniref:SPOR domain-containing protein n=1 Tax=Mesohalobacter halotolerans TaxID=1883405 RepID=A0A4U5TPC3_9FLAO|nr:SPOR domain-containing protein [Mesohalobacter halotolerans]MBS3738022.1 SPOR domain-containing protein [Psychroflexus sp.]TKS55806.1 SPOR domain-containing protein [Mesohalobacter halotolerans]